MTTMGTDRGFKVLGIGAPPIQLRISAKGYQEKKVTLYPAEQHQKVRVELDKMPNNDEP
jgi:hypothetical protein